MMVAEAGVETLIAQPHHHYLEGASADQPCVVAEDPADVQPAHS